MLVLRRLISSEVLDRLTERQFKELVFKVKTSPGIQANWAELPRHTHLIACRDGVIDLDTGKCRPARPDDYLFSKNNFSIEEIGRGGGERFEAFLYKCSDGNREIQQLMMEIIGVAISSYRPRKFFLFLGEPRTGKSQLADLIAHMVGDDSVHAIDTPDGLGKNFAMGSVVDKKLCICGDAEDAILSTKAVALIKQITGGDPVMVEIKYQQPFSAVCEALLLFCSNEPLKFRHDRGMRDRLITVPFYNPVRYAEAVEGYAEVLFEERGYIAGKAIQALQILRARRFQFTHVAAEGAEEFDGDVSNGVSMVTSFVAQCCTFQSEAHALSRDIYREYTEFCTQVGQTPIGYSAFFRMFSAQYPELERTNLRAGRGYRGIRIKT